jgi:catechol 2,3-dioxygenase-like lactoylglutathione lyase family enzyme
MTTEGRLSHVEIYVSDLSTAAEFYEWFLGELGYRPYQEWDLGRSWKLDDAYLVIVQVAQDYSDPAFHRRRVGLNHLAFHAASAERVDSMRDELAQRGVPILYDSPHSGATPYALYFEGPDRLKLEYVWEGAHE